MRVPLSLVFVCFSWEQDNFQPHSPNDVDSLHDVSIIDVRVSTDIGNPVRAKL